MDNETKLSSQQINSIKQELSDKKDPKEIENIMEKHLTEKQCQAVKSFLSDEKKLQSLFGKLQLFVCVLVITDRFRRAFL